MRLELFYHIISYHIISYHIISYHIISYHIISYHIISYHIISYFKCKRKSIMQMSNMSGVDVRGLETSSSFDLFKFVHASVSLTEIHTLILSDL